jgi:hypothetical protein
MALSATSFSPNGQSRLACSSADRRPYRTDVHDCYVCGPQYQVRRFAADWITHYDEVRTHESLSDAAGRPYFDCEAALSATINWC